MIKDLGHLAMAVSDLERSIAFYELLGLREAFRLHHPDGRLRLVYLHVAGERFLELFPGGVVLDRPLVENFRHLCFLSDGLQEELERLRAAGVVVVREPQRGDDGAWQARVRDPDGNVVELMEVPPDALQKSAQSRLDNQREGASEGF